VEILIFQDTTTVGLADVDQIDPTPANCEVKMGARIGATVAKYYLATEKPLQPPLFIGLSVFMLREFSHHPNLRNGLIT